MKTVRLVKQLIRSECREVVECEVEPLERLMESRQRIVVDVSEVVV